MILKWNWWRWKKKQKKKNSKEYKLCGRNIWICDSNHNFRLKTTNCTPLWISCGFRYSESFPLIKYIAEHLLDLSIKPQIQSEICHSEEDNAPNCDNSQDHLKPLWNTLEIASPVSTNATKGAHFVQIIENPEIFRKQDYEMWSLKILTIENCWKNGIVRLHLHISRLTLLVLLNDS